MGNKGEGNRQRIVEAADELFYRRGYNQTSFQDISDSTGIPRGNFYYYFRTKDEILNAVVDARLAELSIMLKQCDVDTDDPRERLLRFSNMLEYNLDDVLQSGCPIGTLSSELVKDDPELHEKSQQAFQLLRDWIIKQFDDLGFSNAGDLAMDLLAKMQGATVMGCAFKDADFIRRSHEEIKGWIKQKTAS
jgi:AcrR family transcriptional regulator